MSNLGDAFTTTAPVGELPLSRKRRTTPAPLSSEVESLAKSLGVQPVEVDGKQTYRPDAFVRAIRHVHNALVEVNDDLKDQKQALDARERALDAREQALLAREERQEAFGALGELVAFRAAPAPRRGILAAWLGRR